MSTVAEGMLSAGWRGGSQFKGEGVGKYVKGSGKGWVRGAGC